MGCAVMNRRRGRVGGAEGRKADVKGCFENQQEVDWLRPAWHGKRGGKLIKESNKHHGGKQHNMRKKER